MGCDGRCVFFGECKLIQETRLHQKLRSDVRQHPMKNRKEAIFGFELGNFCGSGLANKVRTAGTGKA